ncbi:hypothetical protein [Herbidospora mongoliensis]|uniref:hypothetical protein n=1 Tax=Herbidospora mongoliensis TaxID=688067 RepID=UPI000830A240|nr:hypothetical protein [Herbidospora mongoliensis]
MDHQEGAGPGQRNLKAAVWLWIAFVLAIPAGCGALFWAVMDDTVTVDDSIREEISAGLGIVDMYEGAGNGAGSTTFEAEYIVLRTTVDRQVEAMRKVGWTLDEYGNLRRDGTHAAIGPLPDFIREWNRDDGVVAVYRAAQRFATNVADPENHVVVELESGW